MSTRLYTEYWLLAYDAMEEFLMGEIETYVEIWGNEDCPECERVKEHYSVVGYCYNDINMLLSGVQADVEAMAQLAYQHMRLPLVRENGEWINLELLKERLESEVA